jgi:hypothetical protein
MFKRRLAVVLVLGLGAVFGCTDLTYNCAGLCGAEVGNGDFEGSLTANSLPEALAACDQKCGCDAGYLPTCSCYLQE